MRHNIIDRTLFLLHKSRGNVNPCTRTVTPAINPADVYLIEIVRHKIWCERKTYIVTTTRYVRVGPNDDDDDDDYGRVADTRARDRQNYGFFFIRCVFLYSIFKNVRATKLWFLYVFFFFRFSPLEYLKMRLNTVPPTVTVFETRTTFQTIAKMINRPRITIR